MIPEHEIVNRTPPEILSEIFTHCLPVDSASQDTQQLLSSVCGPWRALVLATPALWASLDITCINDVLRPPLSVIHTHLQRSRTHPLSFILRAAKPEEYCDDNPHLLTVLAALAAARHRWDNVDITLNKMTQDILDLITLGNAPLLRSIRCDAKRSQTTLPLPLRMLDCSPHLESFNWGTFESPLLLPLVNTSLTSVSLFTTLSVSECITILRLSPHLTSASFRNFRSSNESPPALHLTHPTLRTLAAAGQGSIMFLDTLTLPALLDLDLTIDRADWDIIISTFIARSKPTLHKLILIMMDTWNFEPTILHILALAPALRSLELFYMNIAAPFTAALIRALSPLHLHPALSCARVSRAWNSPGFRAALMACAPQCSVRAGARKPKPMGSHA
ncbi:hypothetical protein BD779DRAFT_1679353 [Infundibulicybe gibba]|nr:hypothetical protein BD779DRAFT_1679353 [Infundibulicybe gibba]